MALTKQNIIDALAVSNPDYVVCDCTSEEIGTDEIGLPIYKTVYINPPLNIQWVKTIDQLQIVILKDLDYVAPQEPTNEVT